MTDPLARIADALDRLAPPAPPAADPAIGDAFVFEGGRLRAVAPPPAQPLARFVGVDAQRDALAANLRRHAAGAAAHDVLLWGARGMGKSSLVRSVHAITPGLVLVQVARDDLDRLPALFRTLGPVSRRFVVYADDVSFEADERQYKALRSVLDGGIEARPDHVRLIVTSNRRHLVAREHADTEGASAVNARDVLDDRLALADRFGPFPRLPQRRSGGLSDDGRRLRRGARAGLHRRRRAGVGVGARPPVGTRRVAVCRRARRPCESRYRAGMMAANDAR